MHRAIPSLNKHVQRKEEQRNRVYHLEHLKQMRPITTGVDDHSQPVINNRKRELLLENRFTEIQRENRILLEKISGIMAHKGRTRGKRGTSGFVSSKEIPRSLNVTFRKKQFQEIEIQNAKLLRRLQEKKSDYQVDKMNREWKKKKYVIRNISSYPIAIFQKKRKDRAETGLMNRTYKQRGFSAEKGQRSHPRIINSPNNAVEVVRNKNITGHNFIVTVKLDETKMTISAVPTNDKSQAKVIEIPKDEALIFLAEECEDRIEGLFDLLYFDGETLFLIGEADVNGEPELPYSNQQTLKKSQPTITKEEKPKKHSLDQEQSFAKKQKKSEVHNNQEVQEKPNKESKQQQNQAVNKGDNVERVSTQQNIAPSPHQQYPQQHFGQAIDQLKVTKLHTDKHQPDNHSEQRKSQQPQEQLIQPKLQSEQEHADIHQHAPNHLHQQPQLNPPNLDQPKPQPQ